MTATALTKPRDPGTPQRNGLTSGQLPRFFEVYALVGSLVVVGVAFMLMGFNVVGWLVVTAIIYLVAVGVFVWSRFKVYRQYKADDAAASAAKAD